MKCTQTNCGKTFIKPLELYNGALVCPHCKKELSVVSDFKITVRNQELFNLSELYFYRYLSPKSQDTTRGSALKLAPEEMVELAIENCRQAAKEGNPYAVYKMGYYNEFFMETKRSENDRIRVAFNYYASICYSDIKKPKVETGAPSMSDEEFANLKYRAGVSLINLYAHYSQALKGTSKYDYEKNKQRLTSLYGEIQENEGQVAKRAGSRIKSVFKVLLSCLNKTRAPLWGLFLLTGVEFKNLFTLKKYAKDKKPEVYKLISKGVELRYLPCNSDGTITKDIDERYFINLASEDRVKEILSEVRDDDNFYLYLFNPKGTHEFLSGSQIKRIGKKLAENSYEAVCSLIDYSAQEYLFFDDDIVVFKRGGKIERCVDSLVEKISGEDE